MKAGLYLGVNKMPKEDREATLSQWISGDITAIVATEAFGLGVNFIIRRVILFGLPFSIRSLWQRLGRGGRDGKAATGCIYWNWQDVHDLNWMSKDKPSEVIEKGPGELHQSPQASSYFLDFLDCCHSFASSHCPDSYSTKPSVATS